jgi:hypothetical protein
MVRKEKKSKLGAILVFFIAFIMISSIIGFIYSGESDTFKYKDIKFTRTQNQWSAVINNRKMVFNYFPAEVEGINVSSDVITALLNKPEIDTTSMVDDMFAEEIALAQYNMALTLNNFNIYVRRGFTTNNTFDLPIISCEDATFAVPIIYFEQSNQTKVSMENDCIIAEARNNFDVLRVKDRLLYSILGIIE